MALAEKMYLHYNTQQEAKIASQDYWVRLLGHPVTPGDFSNFIFQVITNPQNNDSFLVLLEPLYSKLFPLLTAQEQLFVNANMVPVSNSRVQACLDALAALNPVHHIANV